MQVHETEKSLEDIQSYVNEVFEFIVSNAGTYEANEMEEAIKKKIFRLSKEFLKSYFLEKGTGDKGAELDTVNGIYERDRRLHKKNYYSIFGKIEVNRTCYKKNGTDNIYPLDMEANLPERSYSYVLQEFMNLESSKHPFKDSSETIGKFLDLDLSVNALEIVSKDSVCDYETFYEKYEVKEVSSAIVVISYDGKGIPMTSKESEKIKGRENKDESNKVRLGKGKKSKRKKKR